MPLSTRVRADDEALCRIGVRTGSSGPRGRRWSAKARRVPAKQRWDRLAYQDAPELFWQYGIHQLNRSDRRFWTHGTQRCDGHDWHHGKCWQHWTGWWAPVGGSGAMGATGAAGRIRCTVDGVLKGQGTPGYGSTTGKCRNY